MLRGGERRIVLSPQPSINRPCAKALSRMRSLSFLAGFLGFRWGADATPVHDALAGDHRADRHSGGDALRGADDVRLPAPVFRRPPAAGATDARLHFVNDHQDSILVTQATQSRKEPVGRHDITTFTLDRL